MCMAANVPLVESGTAGYLGQVQPILKVRPTRFDPRQSLMDNRTGRSVSIALSNRLLRLSQSVPFARRLHSRFIASFGPKAISCRKFEP